MVFPQKTKANKPKSQAYLRDLAYINIAGSFFTNASNYLLQEFPLLYKNENKDTEDFIKLHKDLKAFSYDITMLVGSPVHTKQDSIQFEKYCQKLKDEFLKIAHKKNVSFDLMACWILYARFFNSKHDLPKKYDLTFSLVVDKKRILDLTRLVLDLGVEDLALEWELALKLSKVL